MLRIMDARIGYYCPSGVEWLIFPPTPLFSINYPILFFLFSKAQHIDVTAHSNVMPSITLGRQSSCLICKFPLKIYLPWPSPCTCVVGINRIYHHTVEEIRESHPSAHDFQSTTRLAESWLLQIMDTRMGFTCPFHNVVIDYFSPKSFIFNK